jgi:hypothetical protein
MARFRIVQRPIYTDPTQPRFDIQEEVLGWWEFINFAFTFEEAEVLLLKIKTDRENPIETKVIKEYVL